MVKKTKAKVPKGRSAEARLQVSKSSKPHATASMSQLSAKFRRIHTALEAIEARLTGVEQQLISIDETHALRKRNEDQRHESLRSEVEIVAKNLGKLRSEFNAIQGSGSSSGDLRSRHGQLVENPPRGVDANARGELRRD
jgi:hypothetical protein